ncbi:AAA family ATPase [Halolamina sediminis]|uniref:AAA family ATPase n=1 Tax=Halolamina sediminis TaxID=1480675 RepID=UPI0006B58D2B|nr:AAA family ATPase [Halolamina sediminis]
MNIDPDKLKENYLPNAMPGREPKLQRISDVLEPATEGEPAGSVWEIGPSGVGKTSTAQFLLKEAREWGVDWMYLPCTSYTRWGALQKIADKHPTSIARPNASTNELTEWIAAGEQPFVVILDGIGALEDPELLANLADAEWLSLILIGHKRANALGQVPDHADRLRFAELVEFDPYDATALFDILAARREVALKRGVVDDAQLERIIAEAEGRRGSASKTCARRSTSASSAATQPSSPKTSTTVSNARTSASDSSSWSPWAVSIISSIGRSGSTGRCSRSRFTSTTNSLGVALTDDDAEVPAETGRERPDRADRRGLDRRRRDARGAASGSAGCLVCWSKPLA